jgi:hypothetical protein
MNSSITRAWAVVTAGLGLAVTQAEAQFVPPFQDYEILCDDISTTNSNFSANWNVVRHRNDLFGFTVGTRGTVDFELCFTDNGFTADVGGRIGFQIGRIGSIQDEAVEGLQIDDDLMLTMGMPYGVGANWGYAKIVRQADDGALTLTAFGDDDSIDSFFIGASDRYAVAEDTVDNVLVTLRVDLIGDAARLDWGMQNLDAEPTRLGLWFGQWVVARGPQTSTSSLADGIHYVKVPGQRPLNVDTRFANSIGQVVPAPSASEPTPLPLPDYVNFGLTQAWAYGLQVVNRPTPGANSALFDQTEVDTFDFGSMGTFRSPSLLGPIADNSRPMSPAFSELWNDVFVIDPGTIPALTGAAYIQRWNPQPVSAFNTSAAERTRHIIAYYKSTTGQSDYARPYSAVVDGPRTIAVVDNNPFQRNPGTATIRVYIDNTRGFSTNQQSIPLNDVRIQLDLPQGMTDANNPGSNRIVQTIDRVEPNNAAFFDPSNPLEFVDFQVDVAPEVVGTQFYTVTIQPQPGSKKVINGVVNVASTPHLQIREQANLVTAPWNFASTTWGTILGGGANPLVPDVDYQAFTWDAQRQEYVLQTGPQRGRGTFIISRRNVGYKPLGGTPRTPDDLAEDGPLIQLKSGWNLIANPYNYPIEIGQIIGVAGTDPTQSVKFQDLVNAGVISGSLAYWDSTTQSYKFTQDFTSEMLPNVGYWIFVTTVQDVTLSFPPVFTPFVPRGTGGIEQIAGWSLNMVARTSGGGLDDQNYLAVAKSQAVASSSRIVEPPVAPMKGSVSLSFREGAQSYARSVKAGSGRFEWTVDVTPRSNDTVTLTWPNVSALPSNVSLRLIDPVTNMSYDMRKVGQMSFFGRSRETVSYRVVAEDRALQPILSNVSASAGRTSGVVRYALGESAITNVRILRTGRVVSTLARNHSELGGNRSLTWNLSDGANRRVRPGVYVAEVSATVNGRTETKTVSFLVR